MSNNSNTSRILSNESENKTNQFEGMCVSEIFMQEINSPFSQHLINMCYKKFDEASSSNPHNKRKRKYINRVREIGEERIMKDYFYDHPVYTNYQFRTR